MSMHNRLVANGSSLSNSSIHIPMTSSNIFTTQHQSTSGQKEVQQRHNQLNNYIDVLDEKVKKMIECNEAQLLLAYKNHIYKVRRDIQEFKDQTTKALKQDPSHAQKVEILEKQLIVFREEAMRLFSRLVQKDQIIEKLTMQKEEITKAHSHLQQTVKKLMQQNKVLQRERTMNREKTISAADRIRTAHDRTNTQEAVALTEENEQEIPRPSTTSLFMRRRIPNKQADLLRLSKGNQSKVTNHETSFQRTGYSVYAKFHPQSQKHMKNRMLGPSRTTSALTRQKRDYVGEDELKEVFGRCVWAIRKQIARRKKANTLNFYKEGSPITLEQFKESDLHGLMQMVFSSQQMTQLLYQKLVMGKQEIVNT